MIAETAHRTGESAESPRHDAVVLLAGEDEGPTTEPHIRRGID
ncbi:hypothetical protein [Streptomyces sp. ISL-11]|nr:hypothetical protein [Streptomyces sp. ISL-11]